MPQVDSEMHGLQGNPFGDLSYKDMIQTKKQETPDSRTFSLNLGRQVHAATISIRQWIDALARKGTEVANEYDFIKLKPTSPDFGTAFPIERYDYKLAAKGADVTTMRHHVVPRNLLLMFWNALVGSKHMGALSEMLVVIADNIGRHGMRYTQKQITDMKGCAAHIKDCEHVPGKPKSIDAYGSASDDLFDIFCYIPANFFMGPSKRCDDPDNAFEVNSWITIGMDNYHLLYRLHETIKGFCSVGDDKESAKKAVSEYCTIIKSTHVYPMNVDKWAWTQCKKPKDKNSKKIPRTDSAAWDKVPAKERFYTLDASP